MLKRYTNASTYTHPKASVITIGTFDGVHIGHKKIIERLVVAAQEKGLTAVLLTFFPHPRMVLQKDTDIKLINTIEERIQILEKTGLHSLVIHPFTMEFSRLSAKDYVQQMLVDDLNAAHVIIGYDHRFGRNRNADITDLIEYGEQHDFTVEQITKQDIEDVAISSTKIRKALFEGDIQKANTYLGYPFMLTGTVIHGKALGRTLNYPTANLHIKEDYKLIPKKGVYVVQSTINGILHYGMMNIGDNPTVAGKTTTIEAHFFDVTFDLYDQNIQIELLTRIRDEEKFDSIAVLKDAMQRDEAFSRQFITTLS